MSLRDQITCLTNVKLLKKTLWRWWWDQARSTASMWRTLGSACPLSRRYLPVCWKYTKWPMFWQDPGGLISRNNSQVRTDFIYCLLVHVPVIDHIIDKWFTYSLFRFAGYHIRNHTQVRNKWAESFLSRWTERSTW